MVLPAWPQVTIGTHLCFIYAVLCIHLHMAPAVACVQTPTLGGLVCVCGYVGGSRGRRGLVQLSLALNTFSCLSLPLPTPELPMLGPQDS